VNRKLRNVQHAVDLAGAVFPGVRNCVRGGIRSSSEHCYFRSLSSNGRGLSTVVPQIDVVPDRFRPFYPFLWTSM
jgi:hypothetical protein